MRLTKKKYAILIEAVPDDIVKLSEIKFTQGKQLVRVRFENIDEAVTWLSKHPNVFVELTIVSENFLSSVDRKRLNDANESIVMIVPEIAGKESTQSDTPHETDLNKSMEDLFKEFFLNKKGQAPNERILNLFKEILSEEEE